MNMCTTGVRIGVNIFGYMRVYMYIILYVQVYALAHTWFVLKIYTRKCMFTSTHIFIHMYIRHEIMYDAT